MNSLASLLSLALLTPGLLFLPGYLTQLWLATRWPLPHGRDWLETIFISLLFGLCLTGWLGLVLVEGGWFSLLRLLGLVAIYCLLMGWLLRGQSVPWRATWVRGDRWTWLLLGVTLLAALLYFHPHEHILGGADAGVYVNLGQHIVRSGALPFHDPELAALDPATYPALFRSQPSYLITRYIQFPGFYLSDDQAGLVIPQFYPLHPVWLAIFNSVGGVRASLYVTPLWGVLATLAVGLTAATLFGRRTGVLAATLLAISATQIWFARYPTSEALTQLLLFGGIYAFSHYVADEAPEMGLLAGLTLGQVMLVRLDTYFLLAIPLLWVAYLRLTRRLGRRHVVFWGPFLILSLHSLAHGLLQSWPYLYNSYHWQWVQLPLPALAAAGGIAVVGFLGLDAWAGGRQGRLSRLARWSSRGAQVLAVLVVLAAFYAYFIRPRQADPAATIAYWYSDSAFPYVEPHNLPRLGWYLSPLGIALAVLGAWWMLRHDWSERTALLLGVGLFFSSLYIQNSRNNPHHIYVMRRYVPAVMPAFTVAAAYAIARWWRRQDYWRWLALPVAVAQVALLLYNARTVLPQVNHRGLVDQLSPWAESLDPQAVVLFNDERPVSSGATVGTPLRYLFGRTVFDLQEQHVTGEILAGLVRSWQAQGRPVLIAVGAHGVREPFAEWPLVPLPGLQLDTTLMESSYQHPPRRVRRFRLSLELYELLPAGSHVTYPLHIDVGSRDFFYLGEGWHGKEQLPDGTTMRWTSGAARFDLAPPGEQEGDVHLRLRMAASAHAAQRPAEVRLRYCGSTSSQGCNGVDGEETSVIARWQVGTAFTEYEAWLPASQDGRLVFSLETETWNPAALGLSSDSRDLGVRVDWISVD